MKLKLQVDGKVFPLKAGTYIMLADPTVIDFNISDVLSKLYNDCGADITMIPCYDLSKVKLLKVEPVRRMK